MLRQEVIPSGDNEVQLPVNLQRLVVKAQTLFGATGGDASFGPLEIVNGINGLVDRLTVVPGKDRLSEEAQRNATILLFNHIRSTLSSKQARPLPPACSPRVASRHAAAAPSGCGCRCETQRPAWQSKSPHGRWEFWTHGGYGRVFSPRFHAGVEEVRVSCA